MEQDFKNYNALAAAIYEQNKAVGWWDNPDRCLFECLQLVSTEVAEATEAERKDLQDDHLPHRKGGEVELADAMIRVLDLGGRLDLEHDGAVLPAHQYGGSLASRHLTINRCVLGMADALYANLGAPVVRRQYSRLVNTIEAVAFELGYDLYGALLEKLDYNRKRADHKRENRAKPGGKAF